METLKGEVAVIGGGLGDIGRAIARELARRGAETGSLSQLNSAKKRAFMEGSL